MFFKFTGIGGPGLNEYREKVNLFFILLFFCICMKITIFVIFRELNVFYNFKIIYNLQIFMT